MTPTRNWRQYPLTNPTNYRYPTTTPAQKQAAADKTNKLIGRSPVHSNERGTR